MLCREQGPPRLRRAGLQCRDSGLWPGLQLPWTLCRGCHFPLPQTWGGWFWGEVLGSHAHSSPRTPRAPSPSCPTAAARNVSTGLVVGGPQGPSFGVPKEGGAPGATLSRMRRLWVSAGQLRWGAWGGEREQWQGAAGHLEGVEIPPRASASPSPGIPRNETRIPCSTIPVTKDISDAGCKGTITTNYCSGSCGTFAM